MNIDRLKQLHAEMGTILGPNAVGQDKPIGTPIADRAALDAALKVAKGGEVFRLAPGHYGSLEMKPNFDKPVTIIGGEFGSVKILRWHWQQIGKGVILDGIRSPWFEVNAVNNVTIRNCDADQVSLKLTDGVTVSGCWLHDGHFPLRVERSSNFVVEGNVIEGAREDSMRITGDSHHGTVRANVFLRNMAALPMHADHLQIFGISGEDVCPHDLLIEDNLLHDSPFGKTVLHLKDRAGAKAGTTGQCANAQGFFLGAAQKTMYRNITIRRNLIRIAMTNAIFTSAGIENFRIEQNIVVPIKGTNIARIMLNKDRNNAHWRNTGTTVTGNIAPLIEDESKDARMTGNLAYGTEIEGLFAGITGTEGGDAPEHYRLAAQSRIPGDLVARWLEGTIATIRGTLDGVKRG